MSKDAQWILWAIGLVCTVLQFLLILKNPPS